MESSWLLHHERVCDLDLVWGGLCRHREATDACGAVEPTQVLLVCGHVKWPTKVVHIGGSLCGRTAQNNTFSEVLVFH